VTIEGREYLTLVWRRSSLLHGAPNLCGTGTTDNTISEITYIACA
jgi:hypothetical protein